jgi:hypothetical protein
MLAAKKGTKNLIMTARVCVVSEFLVRGVEFDFVCAEHFYRVKGNVKVFDNEVLRSIIDFTGDEVRILVAFTMFVSDIPFLSHSPCLSLIFRFFLIHLICP